VCAVLEYLFRVKNVRQVTKLFRQLGLLFSPIKDPLISNGYLMKNVKLWLYYRHCNGATLGLTSMFEVRVEDYKLHHYVSSTLDKHFRSWRYAGYKALTLIGFDRSVFKVYTSVETYTKKFVYRKMRFIVNAQSVTPLDLVNDCRDKALAALMHKYPCVETMLHAQNLARRTIKNHGMNLIDHYTTQSRNRTIRNPDGTFSNNVIPLHSLETGSDLTQSLDWYMADATGGRIDSIRECDASRDLKITVKNLLSSYSGKRKAFITLLMGGYNQQFSEWLHSQGIKLDNDELFDRQPLAYIKHSLTWLDVSQEAGQRFIGRLQEHFSSYALATCDRAFVA
jgi:hypothetical protein